MSEVVEVNENEVESALVQFEDGQMSLGDLWGLDMGEVEASTGFETLPEGNYTFLVKETKLAVVNHTKNGVKSQVGAIKVINEVLGVNISKLSPEKQAKLVGKTYVETYKILADDPTRIGEFKTVCQRTGTEGAVLKEMAAALVGKQYSANVVVNEFNGQSYPKIVTKSVKV